MAAYAALVSLMNFIEQMMSHPRLSTSLHNRQTDSLRVKAGSLLDFPEGCTCTYGGVMNKEVEDLERRIAFAAHAAEVAIETHIADQILAPSVDDGETSSTFLLRAEKKIRGVKKKMIRYLKRRISSQSHAAQESHIVDQAPVGSWLDLQHIIEDMDAILKRVNELKERINASKEEQPTHSRPLRVETAMVGFDDELIQLLDELTNQRSNRHVISIVGMGGMGKTTLAQNVYQNSLIVQHFDIRAWVTVSHQYNVEQILSQLLSGLEKSSRRTVDDLGLKLHKTLSGRRYLIVLDDIWSVEAWDQVRHFFPENGNRSRVVLTTRLGNVARDCHSNSCLMLKPLDEHKGWKLFCKKAFQQENCPYPQLEKVGKEIARLCKGLPLSTVVIGGLLLNSPRSLQFWENVFRNIKSVPNAKEKEESLDILCLSYNHLPPHLKPCFLYMGLFKEDSEIRVSKIIQLWIAEGFVRPKEAHALEEAAESYLKELIDRNLISVSKHGHNGKIGSCRIHDLNALSLLPRKSDGPLNHHKLQRVCNEDLYGDGNVNLRYLAYKQPHCIRSMWNLPNSVFLMWNLQTLLIKFTMSNRVVLAPAEIWKMRQLKHVKCSQIYVPNPPRGGDGLLMMDNLQTLTTAVNLRLSKKVCKMIPNIKKLHIAYGIEWKGYDDSLIELLHNLDCLHKLESLKLNMGVGKWPTQDQELHKVVRFPISLNKLSLRSCLRPQLNKIVRFPISLNKLSLCGCQLGWEDLSMIGSLPQLEVLQLKIYSVTGGNKWSPIEGQFLRLKFLKIDWCNLQYWEAGESHFPVLEKLLVSQLWYLEEIPLGMGEIPTLELIRLNHCSESAAVSAVRIKEDQLENQGSDALLIQVVMFDSQLESLKERLDTEGITINNIQLRGIVTKIVFHSSQSVFTIYIRFRFLFGIFLVLAFVVLNGFFCLELFVVFIFVD